MLPVPPRCPFCRARDVTPLADGWRCRACSMRWPAALRAVGVA